MRKRDLLNILAEHADLDAAAVAQELECTRSAAGMLLMRLARQGLIQRALDEDDELYFYSLTDKGRARLAYWTQIAQRER